MIIGERIAALMQAQGVSQAELARRVGVSQPAVFGLIHTNKSGSAHLHKVARELHTTTAYLTGESDDPECDAPLPDYSSDERDLIELIRGMAPKDRAAILQLARTIAHSATTPAVHAGRHEFRGAE